jgi:hypothetical protein
MEWRCKYAFLKREKPYFLHGPCKVVINKISGEKTDSHCVEAASNTSTVTLRVVGGDKKGSLKYETVKYGYESKGTRTQERLRWRVPREDAHKTGP